MCTSKVIECHHFGLGRGDSGREREREGGREGDYFTQHSVVHINFFDPFCFVEDLNVSGAPPYKQTTPPPTIPSYAFQQFCH